MAQIARAIFLAKAIATSIFGLHHASRMADRRCGWSGDLLQSLPLRFQVGPGIVVGRVEAHVAEPASNDCNVDARRDEVHGGGVPEGVWRYMLGA